MVFGMVTPACDGIQFRDRDIPPLWHRARRGLLMYINPGGRTVPIECHPGSACGLILINSPAPPIG
jgi:hypothetical protein